jgi:membrane fusion protein (multidrug efflux system)
MNARLLRAVLLLVVLLLSACTTSVDEEDTDTANERRIRVVTQTLVPTDLTETFTLPTQLEALNDITLSAEIAGNLVRVHVEEGAEVTAGQILLEIDADTIRSQLVREEQNVAVLTRTHDRLERLESQGLVSRQEFDEVINRLAAAQATLRLAQLQFEKSTPRSPLNGVVDRRHVEPGEYVDPGTPLVRVVMVDQLKAVADVPEKDVAFIAPGQQVDIVNAAVQGRDPEKVSGVIEHIAFVADPATRTYRTTMLIEEPGTMLRPGMIVRTTFVRMEHEQAIVVPLSAVIDRQGRKIVYVVEEGTAREVEVVPGSFVGPQVVIRSGLEAGQQLVTKGQQLLIDGALVTNAGN